MSGDRRSRAAAATATAAAALLAACTTWLVAAPAPVAAPTPSPVPAPVPAPVERSPQPGSIVAVLTHRGGIAGAFAHDHLIGAPLDAVRIRFDPADPASASLRLATTAGALAVDESAAREEASPRLRRLGLIDRDLAPLGEKDRRKIRDAMLGRGQLAAAEHPAIRVATGAIREDPREIGGVAFPFAVEVTLEAGGGKATAEAAARFERVAASDDGPPVLRIEAVAELRFTDLGIEPYSAMLGAVRNRDAFHLYVSVALPAESGDADGGSPR